MALLMKVKGFRLSSQHETGVVCRNKYFI
jgi:hypothetical protein